MLIYPELWKKPKKENLFKSPIIEHLAHVISESGSWNNNISSTNYGEDVRGLFRELATYTSEEGFDSMLQASQYIFSSDEANEIIKIVATKRHPGNIPKNLMIVKNLNL